MLTKDEILEYIQQNVTVRGTAQYNFSHDMETKRLEQMLLNELISDGYLEKAGSALGFWILQVL